MRCFSSRARTGFTLVELLVVIAIIGVLVGLLLPAVQAAREAARRMQCSNNLKQIGLALHNYHDTHNAFPSLVVNPAADPDNAGGGEDKVESWGWAALILPFIEQGPLHQSAGIGTGRMLEAELTGAAMQVIPAYRCPSDTGSAVDDPTQRYMNGAGSNYAAYNSSRTAIVGSTADGAFYVNSGRKFRDITDGLSNTLAVGESAARLNATNMCLKSWAGCVTGIGGNCIDEVALSGRWPINDSTGTVDQKCEALSSVHPGGAMVLMHDGGVRFLSENIQFLRSAAPNNNTSAIDSLYEYLIGINDGNPLGEF